MTASPSSKLLVTLATKNEGKRLELQQQLQNAHVPLELVINHQAIDVEETGSDFLENAWLKAQQTEPVIPEGYVLAEDSGLVVDALDGCYGLSPFPGLYSNRWLSREIRDELLGRSYPNRLPLDRTTDMGVTNSDLCHAILHLMRGETNRRARYCCGMVLWRAGMGKCFETLQSTELQIIEGEPRGLNGFGYDPITVPVEVLPGSETKQRSMAELSSIEKNAISHRGKAFKQIIAFLRQQENFQ